MNICVFTRTLQRGGAEKQSILLTRILSKSHKVFLVVLHDLGTNYYSELLKGVNVKLINLTGGFINKCFTLYRILKKEKINLLFCYLLSTNIIGAFAGRVAGVNCIVGGIRNSFHPPWKECLLKYGHNFLTHFTIVNHSKSLQYLINKGFKENKLIVIPNGIAVKNCMFEKNYKSKISIITVARLVEQKDYFTAIDSFKLFHNRIKSDSNMDYEYLIIGYGELKNEIQNYIDENKLESNIKIIESDNPEKFLQYSDIYLSTSLYEGLSNSILEAMNNCLPIVATDVGENSKLVKENVNGFLVPTKDVNSICKSLYNLATNSSLRLYMGAQSHKLLEDSYSLEKFENNYQKFIKRISANIKHSNNNSKSKSNCSNYSTQAVN
jgi:glycosyltransferase involved in cell wall biosynthesis